MRKAMFFCAVIALMLATASAQTKTTMTGKCSKPSVQQSVPAGDQQGHAFMIAQGNCTIVASVNGARATQGAFSEEVEATATQMKNRGVYTVTFDSGDKLFYKYQGMATMKDGAYQAGTNTYDIAGGTGKMNDIHGSGSCKLTGNGDGTLDYTCTGSYSVGMPTGNNSRAKGRTPPAKRNPNTP